MRVRTLAFSAILVAAAGVGGWYWSTRSSAVPAFRTATIQRGDLRATISATGTIEPDDVVDIGAQVAGRIIRLGKDPQNPAKTVDYDTPVSEGTILAQIDASLYEADVAQNQAAVEAAKANQEKAEADLAQLRAKLTQAGNDFQRAQNLHSSPGAITAQDYDMFLAAYDSAKAALQVGEATVLQAKRAVTQMEAVLKKAQTNLEYCTIRSPVKGVIIDRRINVGQTVVSSLNAPSLFLIAKDLTRMQIWVSVNEADIGQIRAGQPVTFTVDAHPKETFKGTVDKIRLNATMTNNVVTYTVEVTTDNFSGKLLPYLTAAVSFDVGVHTNVLLVPNAALRWRPQPSQITPGVQLDTNEKGRRKKDTAESGTVWMRDGDRVRPIKVKIGWSDATNSEVSGDELDAGAEVVVGEVRPTDNGSASNPFAPKMFNGNNNKGR